MIVHPDVVPCQYELYGEFRAYTKWTEYILISKRMLRHAAIRQSVCWASPAPRTHVFGLTVSVCHVRSLWLWTTVLFSSMVLKWNATTSGQGHKSTHKLKENLGEGAREIRCDGGGVFIGFILDLWLKTNTHTNSQNTQLLPTSLRRSSASHAIWYCRRIPAFSPEARCTVDCQYCPYLACCIESPPGTPE